MPTKNLVEMVVKTSIGENNALIILLLFFFQAEDGIRDHCVTEFRRVLFRSPRPLEMRSISEVESSEAGNTAREMEEWKIARIRKTKPKAAGVASKHLTLDVDVAGVVRSEEHTSELQSHSDLVCRLLLEKKNM